MNKITIRKPYDFHIHLREDELLDFTIKHACNNFDTILVMPNLKKPLVKSYQVNEYYSSIQTIAKKYGKINTLMTLYLTEMTTINDIIEAKKSKIIVACKLYPKNGTTNSNHGIDMNNITKLYPIFDKMAELELVLCIHGEINDYDIDIFDRETVFINKILPDLLIKFPHLKIVLEHITTKESVELVKHNPNNLSATITPQHLWYNRNDLFVDGIKPHNYCLPILKTQQDQRFLIEATTSGDEHFFAGTDSAPHYKKYKESSCGCAGCFTGYNPIELYLEIFDKYNKLHNAEKFLSINGANFYNIPISDKYITYKKEISYVPTEFIVEPNKIIVPFLAGNTLSYNHFPKL